MNLYHVQDSDRPMWVLAKSWDEAITKWRSVISKENPDVDCSEDQPSGITLLCESDELAV